MPINNPSTSGGAWTQIHDETLAADGAFDVSGLPQVHNHLRATLLARSTAVAVFDSLDFILNADTTVTNYRLGSHDGGTVHIVAATDETAALLVSGASSPANIFTMVNMLISFYTVAQHKVIHIENVVRLDAADVRAKVGSYHWENTAAITRIQIQSIGDQLASGSILQIWGLL